MLIANKNNPDDPIEVPNEEDQSFAERENLLFANVSLIEDHDISECLYRLVLKIVATDAQEIQVKPKSTFFDFFFRGGKKVSMRIVKMNKKQKKKEMRKLHFLFQILTNY